MNRLFMAAFLCVSMGASADVIRTSVGSRVRVPIAGLTAAYSVDTDCAEAEIDGDTVVVIGRSPCATHIVVVAGESVTETAVLVAPSQRNADSLRKAKLLAQRVQESGTVNTFYSSDPGEVETSVNLARTQGNLNTTLAFSLANGYVLSPNARRTAVPYISARFAGPSTSVTLFDSLVDESLLTIESTQIRGLHVETGTWFLHAGIASLIGFRQSIFDHDPDRTIDIGYRLPLGEHSSLTPAVQWIRASHQYVSGQSGVTGSLLYNYQLPQGLHLQLEGASGPGFSGASALEYTAQNNRLQLSVRSTPMDFPGLSMARPRGFQGNGSFTHSFTRDLGLDISAAKNTYSLLDGGKQSNVTGSARLQYRFHHFSMNGGFAGSELTRRTEPSIASISVPVGFSYDSRNFGNSFQYQFSRNRAQDLGSHSFRDSIRFTFGKTTLTAYAGRQSQTPTVSYLLVDLPWLRQALLTAGSTASTPEEIQQFIQTNADLIAGGYLRDLNISLASVRRQAGATMHWTAPRNYVSAMLEWRWDNYRRLTGTVTSTTASANLSLRLNRQTDLTVGASLFKTRSPQYDQNAPLFTVGLRRQLGNVPDLITRFQQRGVIRGIVFADLSGQGSYDGTQKGIAAVTVIIDGVHRTQTDNSGHYSFRSLSESKHRIEVLYESSVPFQFTTPPQVETNVGTIVNFGIAIRKSVLMGTVRSDAHRPLSNVLVRISGPTPSEVRTSESGTFKVGQLESGSYTVAVDQASLPISYVMEGSDPKAVSLKPDQPGRVDFVARALRSVSGQIECNGARVEVSKVDLRFDEPATSVSTDENGRFSIRDISSGRHELLLTYEAKQYRTTIDVPADAVSLHVGLEACGNDPALNTFNSPKSTGNFRNPSGRD